MISLFSKKEWATVADAISEDIVPAMGPFVDNYDIQEIADRFLEFDGHQFRPAILIDKPAIEDEDGEIADHIVKDEFWRIVRQCKKSDEARLEVELSKGVENSWDGEGYYTIAFSDGGEEWTNEGPRYFKTPKELADELRAAYTHATDTHWPYVEKKAGPQQAQPASEEILLRGGTPLAMPNNAILIPMDNGFLPVLYVQARGCNLGRYPEERISKWREVARCASPIAPAGYRNSYMQLKPDPKNKFAPDAIEVLCRGEAFGQMGFVAKEMTENVRLFAEKTKTDIIDLNVAIANVEDIGWKSIPLLLWP